MLKSSNVKIFFIGLDLFPSLSFGKPWRIAKAKRNLGNLHALHAFYQEIGGLISPKSANFAIR
jgi:hypothetical protein